MEYKGNKRKEKSILLALAATVIVCLTSCLDSASNEYRITVPTYATVTTDGAGNYKLYLDEGRGVVVPSPKSAEINWGDTRRAYIWYDIPITSSELKDYTQYSTIVRDARRIDVVETVNLTGMTEFPDTLGTEVVNDFAFQAYWGFLTMQASTGSTDNFSMTCSYDEGSLVNDTASVCDTLRLNFHYAKRDGVWSTDLQPTVCAEIPSLVRGKVLTDSLCITLTGNVWYDSAKDSVVTRTRSFKIARGRLTPPEYN